MRAINNNTNRIIIIYLIILNQLRLCNTTFMDLLYKRATTFIENESCQSPLINGSHFAVVIHGWRESCESDWTTELVKNLSKHRGGCVICMDYKYAAGIPHYFMLAKHVDWIAVVLRDKLRELERRGFDIDDGYLFGFSLGGRIAIRAGIMLGKQRLAEIDTCDMAGPGFDYFTDIDPKDAAMNVQCIHTSSDKGTMFRNCHQNWNMGNCGKSQIAAGIFPGELGSHGLCTRFYNAAFDHNFYAEPEPKQCSSVKMKRFWPKDYKMGYMERRKHKVRGELYASTTDTFPYTEKTKEDQFWQIAKRLSGKFVIIFEEAGKIFIYYKA